MRFGELMKAIFYRGEEAKFLKFVKERDDRSAIHQVDGEETTLPGTGSSSRADAFQPKAKTANRGEMRMVCADTV
jgi:hypothetical protein